VNVSERIDALAEKLTADGYLTNPRWWEALHAVPRHLFTPDRGVCYPWGADTYQIDRAERPEEWWQAAYRDAAIVTQIDDGAGDPATGDGVWTSSLSGPGIVLSFLCQLDPYSHDRVLDVGTGTGWTAGLLSSYVGEDNVTSIEVDGGVAKQAAINLQAAGYCPNLIAGDASTVIADGGPFDRVHVTCGVTTLPYSWVEQTRPGGVIVFPWMPEFGDGHVTTLTVRGEAAIGRFHGGASYMMLRSQRTTFTPFEGDSKDTVTRLDPRRVAWDSYGADLAITGMLPDVMGVISEEDGGRFEMRLQAAGSWATVGYRPGLSAYPVAQHGNRRLWDEVESAYLRWVGWGSPERNRFGMTVTPEGQLLWLDKPSNIIQRKE
jgi:protein-L-isoaspartate O-methyltransferase